MTAPNYVSAADVLAGWREDVLTGKPPTLYPFGSGDIARIEVGPGLVMLLGGFARGRQDRVHHASRG